ncbi:Lar family restriction alleviation protein [Brevundimonas nasdae]|uniref:Lar family restriction alleviation protein n=1 Tax=Brevundimonas nasdae TaxID=172043 RepID=A0ABX8TH95_9CAUL|nr:Lar family restriction alleviation protein [Brevundimonas nasdae]QYC10595.1 Lar family restriction alleviation protein [Brevundimonas nasdae]QYC13382.1 Lar family restriction alleviation protein [Brevundimonas nasdae]
MRGANPCPFCAAHKIGVSRRGGVRFWARCLSCEAEGPTSRTPEEAIARWNARHREEAQQKAITAIHRIVTPDQGENLSDDERAIFAVTSSILFPPDRSGLRPHRRIDA